MSIESHPCVRAGDQTAQLTSNFYDDASPDGKVAGVRRPMDMNRWFWDAILMGVQ